LAGFQVSTEGEAGRADFYAVLYRRGTPVFFAFDAVSIDGRNLRDRPLTARKHALRQIIPRRSGDGLRYVGHVIGEGVRLYRETCARDLEGIVAKWRRSPYRMLDGGPTWLKIKNPSYSQARGRHEVFVR
jgi:ATP-dependent DNA ligase